MTPAAPAPGRLALAIILTLLAALGPLSIDLYLPALPNIRDDLATDAPTVQLTLSVYMAAFAVSQLIFGPLSDRFGRRPVILGGLALYCVACVASALATSIEALIAARFFMAVGACGGPVLSRAVVRDVYEREEAARMLATVASAMALAPALGPVIGGYLTEWFGWRANFWALVGYSAMALVGVALILAETNRSKDPSALRPARMAANYLSLWRNRRYLGYVGMSTFFAGGLFSFISASPFLIVEVLGLAPTAYGYLFAAVAIGFMLGAQVGARTIRRVGIERICLAACVVALMGGGAGAVLAWAGFTTAMTVVGPMTIFMVGLGLGLPASMAGAIQPFPHMAGAASSMLGFVQFLLAAVLGFVVSVLQTDSAIPMATSIGVCAALAGICFVSLVWRGRDAV